MRIFRFGPARGTFVPQVCIVQTEADGAARVSTNPKPSIYLYIRPAAMAKLVAPDGVLFVINDTGPGQAEDEEKHRVKDKTNCK